MTPTKFGIGAPVRRKEDDALLRGRRALCLRSCARRTCATRSFCARLMRMRGFGSGDVDAARRMPGRAAGSDRRRVAELGPLPCRVDFPDGRIAPPPYLLLARDVARHVGDAIAFVVAETLDQASDAAEAIAIDWEPLPHVVDAVAALAPGAPLVWPDRPGNLAFETTLGDRHATDAGLREAARMVALDARQPAARHQLPRHPCGGRRIRRGERPHHADARQPGRPRDPRHPVRRMCCASRRTRCGSSLRTSAAASAPSCFPIANMRLPRSRRKRLRPAGQVGGGADRAFPRRHAGSRQRHRPPSSRSTRKGRFLGARGRHRRRHGRVSVVLCAIHPVSSAPRCCRASTTSRPATFAFAAPTPTRCRSTPIAAPGARRRPT